MRILRVRKNIEERSQIFGNKNSRLLATKQDRKALHYDDKLHNDDNRAYKIYPVFYSVH